MSSPSARATDAATGVVAIERLEHAYPDGTVALRGIDLHIGPGESVTVERPDGTKKTDKWNPTHA